MYFRSHDAGKSEQNRGKERALLQWEKLRPICKSASEKNCDGSLYVSPPGACQSVGSSSVALTVQSLSLHVAGTQVKRSENQPCRPKFLRQKSFDNPAVLPPLDGAAASVPVVCSEVPLRSSPSKTANKPFTSNYSCRDFCLPDVLPVSPNLSLAQPLQSPSSTFSVASHRKSSYAEQKLTELYKEKAFANKFKDWTGKRVCLPVLKENNETSKSSQPNISTIHHVEQSTTILCTRTYLTDVVSSNTNKELAVVHQEVADSASKWSTESDTVKDSPLYSAEIQKSHLILKGKGCCTCLYKNWSSRTIETITTVQFYDVDFDEIACNLSKLTSRFPGLVNVELFNTNIVSFQQLTCLGMLQGVNSLVVGEENNPVTELSLWKTFVCYIMNGCSLQKLNGKEVTVEDTNHAVRLFRGYLNAEWAAQKYVRTIHTQPVESRESMVGEEEEENHNSDVMEALKYEVNPRIKIVAKSFVDNIQTEVVLALKLQNLFAESWPKIFKDITRDAIDDFKNMDTHMTLCMDKLLMNSFASDDL